MFRRFMIVCWVLFGVSVLLGIAGGVLAMHYQADIDATQVRLDQVPKWTPEEAVAELDAGTTLQRLRDRSLLEQEIVKLSSDQQHWVVIALVGLFAGIVLLVWNILWHTGHWIWMGRKVK